MIYDYIKTAFGVLTGILTGNILLTIAIVALSLYVLWITLSLIFSFERRFDKSARKIYDIVYANGINTANFYKINELINKMPSAFVRGWNTFRYKNKGLPSEYIKREDSLDLELSGGVFNRNRSLMRTIIYSVFAFLFLCSIAMLGNEAVITGYALAESALIPLLFLAFAKMAYYIYTAIRQYQYRVAVESFNDLLKAMDNCVVGGQENKGENNYKEDKAEELNPLQNIKAGNETIKIVADKLQADTSEKENKEEVVKKEEVEVEQGLKKRGRPKLEFPAGEQIIIRTDKEFEAALERAEKLMRKSEQKLSSVQAKRVEKNLKELIEAMNKYREEE